MLHQVEIFGFKLNRVQALNLILANIGFWGTRRQCGQTHAK